MKNKKAEGTGMKSLQRSSDRRKRQKNWFKSMSEEDKKTQRKKNHWGTKNGKFVINLFLVVSNKKNE